MKNGDTQLEISALRAGYGGRAVLNEIDLIIGKGEKVALIGPNGCGKSTLFKVLMGLLTGDAGGISFNGKSLEELATEDRVRLGIGYLPQSSNVFPLLKVEENLNLAHLGGGSADWNSAERIEQVLEDFPILKNLLQKRAGLLSGGERQALALGMTLMREGIALLLLDEPIAELSPKAGTEILARLDEIQKREGFAMIIIEHRLRQIQPHVERLVVMRLGKLVADTDKTEKLIDVEWLDGMYLLSPEKTGGEGADERTG